MTEYDSGVIQEMADKLYAQARRTELVWAFMGFVFFAIFMGGGGSLLDETVAVAGMAVGGLLGAVVGFFQGRARAFTLRLQAQTALCQVRIEQNTARASQG